MKPIVVIKLGGSSLVLEETLKELTGLVKGYQKKRYQVVVVHGGGPAINQELESRGITWKFIEGQRQTTPEMMSVIDEVLFGKVNSMLVQSLQQENINAVGLSGAKDGILLCSKASEELMQVGKVEGVDVSAIVDNMPLFKAKVPVIAPIGFGKNGEYYNVNADWAATQIAMALKANKLIFLTDQKGILDQEKQLVTKANPAMVEQMIMDGSISGGMCTKVRAMMLALSSGLKQVRVLHANSASQLIQNQKLGTLLMDYKYSVRQRGMVHGRVG